MANPSSRQQRLLDIIDANRDVLENNREYQDQISDLLGKINTPDDRLQSLFILIGANLSKLLTELNSLQRNL